MSIKKLASLLLLLFCSCCVCMARSEKLYSYTGVFPDGYDFFVRPLPDTTESKKAPIVLFLHGKSLTGNDLNKVLRYGSLDAVRRGVKINAIVVAPQTKVVGWDPSKVNEVLEFVIKKYNGDRNRIYVVGMSMGGSGTLKMVQAYPEKIAAAVALCGGYYQTSVSGLLMVPLWVIHGTNDTAMSCSLSKNLVEKMNSSGKADRLIYDFPPCDHSILARAFYLEELYDWLFTYSLSDADRSVKRQFDMTAERITNAYSTIKHSPVNFIIEEGK